MGSKSALWNRLYSSNASKPVDKARAAAKATGGESRKPGHADENEIKQITSKLARFATDNMELVRVARPQAPDCLQNREQDNWEPLLGIADVVGGRWPAKARNAARLISESEDKDNQDDRVALLADILGVFQQKNVDRCHSYELLDALCSDDEAPWATWNRGDPMTPRQLSSKLKEFKIKSADVRIGRVVKKGYTIEKFSDAFNRYLPDNP